MKAPGVGTGTLGLFVHLCVLVSEVFLGIEIEGASFQTNKN